MHETQKCSELAESLRTHAKCCVTFRPSLPHEFKFRWDRLRVSFFCGADYDRLYSLSKWLPLSQNLKCIHGTHNLRIFPSMIFLQDIFWGKEKTENEKRESIDTLIGNVRWRTTVVEWITRQIDSNLVHNWWNMNRRADCSYLMNACPNRQRDVYDLRGSFQACEVVSQSYVCRS